MRAVKESFVPVVLAGLLLVFSSTCFAQSPLKKGQHLNVSNGMGIVLVKVLEVRGGWIRVNNLACRGLDRGGTAQPDNCWVNTALIRQLLPIQPAK